MDMISKADIEEFHDKGFLVVKNCFSNFEINEALKKTQEFEIKQPNDWKQGTRASKDNKDTRHAIQTNSQTV